MVSIQHHGLFSLIPYMRPWTTLSVYTTPWSLLTYSKHETRAYSICLYNTMVSFCLGHTWDHKHHGLFPPIPYMRPGTTRSVYTIPWSLLINSIHETRDHSICLYNTMVSSYQFYAWEHGLLYLYTQHHGLFSPIPYMRPWTTLSVYTTPVSSHQLYTWDQGPLYLSIQHHGLFSPSPYMRPGPILSVFTTPWSLSAWAIHETIKTMVSSHQFHTWDQGPLSVYTIPWSLLSNSSHEKRDHSICIYITPWSLLNNSIHETRDDQGPLYLSIQFHGLFSPICHMRKGAILFV